MQWCLLSTEGWCCSSLTVFAHKQRHNLHNWRHQTHECPSKAYALDPLANSKSWHSNNSPFTRCIISGTNIATLEQWLWKYHCNKWLCYLKGIVHFAINFLKCFSLPQGHPRCRCLCVHSKPLLSISHTLKVKGVHVKNHAEKSKLNMIYMTRKCKYT